MPTRAVIIAGAGSTADFIERAFPLVRGAVHEVRALGPHGGDLGAIDAALRAEVARARTDGCRIILGGVSFGAHASALYAASCHPRERPDALACVMPAWTGPPDATAMATAATADLLRERGIPAVLDQLEAQFPGDWVVAELRSAWSDRTATSLTLELRAVAASPSPSTRQLAGIGVPTVVLGVVDDPLHPLEVAQSWAGSIPGAVLATLSRADLGADPSLLGRLAFEALATGSR